MRVPNKSASEQAFTRLELAVVLAVLCLLAAVTWPALAVSAARSERATCLNNLRQIGRGFQIWGNDHGGENPWRVPYANGGSVVSPVAWQPWYQFYLVQAGLPTPRILLCPSDNLLPQRRRSDDWTTGPFGLVNTLDRDASVSYILGLHTAGAAPQSLLSGDRNLRGSGLGICGLVAATNVFSLQKGDANVGWTNAIHGLTGNLLLNDGSVLQSSTADLQDALNAPNVSSESNLFHVITPSR